MIKTSVILCGGKATRFNNGKPGPLKPMLKIKGIPILNRIIDIYIKSGVNKIILLGGYKFHELKKIKLKKNNIKLIVLNTGLHTQTGGRLIYLKKVLKKNELFFLTYGDSLTDFNPKRAYDFFLKKKGDYLISYYKKKNNYGTLILNDKKKLLKKFFEKKKETFVNAGFYIMNTNIIKFILSKKESLEKTTIPNLLKLKKKIIVYKCNFWHPMDNDGDRVNLENFFLFANRFIK